MAIALRSSLAWAVGVGTPQSSTIPGTPQVGDLMIAYMGLKPPTADPTVTTAGWTLIPNTASNNGATASGVDTGSVRWSAYYKFFATGDTTVSWALTGVNVSLRTIHVFYSTTSDSWCIPIGRSGSDTSSGTDFALVMSAMDLQTNDTLLGYSSLPGDNATFGTPTLTGTGLTFAAPTEDPATEGTTASGQDFESTAMYAAITAGKGDVAVTMGWTLSVAQTGGGCLIRLREAKPLTENYKRVSSANQVGGIG